MSQRAVEPAIASKLEYAKEQNKEIAAVMKELELVSTVMAQTKALEGGNKSASWDLSSAQKQAEEADKNLMYTRQRMRDVKEREAETRMKVCSNNDLFLLNSIRKSVLPSFLNRKTMEGNVNPCVFLTSK